MTATVDTIVSRFLGQARLRPSAPAYHVRRSDGWTAVTWGAYVAEVRRAARALIALGVGARADGSGSQSCVCILGFNKPEWAILDLAAMAVGAAPAGIYTTCSPSEVAYIVGHTEATLVLVENAEQWKKLESQRDKLPALKHVVTMRGAEVIADPMVMPWEAFLEAGNDVSEAEVDARVHALKPGGLATLIYTSGTTGPPKGVMLTHENLAWTARSAVDMTGLQPSDTSLSYLPLSHIAEQTFTISGPATAGSQVYFAESIERVAPNLQEVQPTVVFGVPRIWEKFYAAVSGKLAEATGLKAKLVGYARKTGLEVSERENGGGEVSGWLGLRRAFFQKKVYGPLREKLGLGRARLCVSGAAPISADVIRFFASLGIVIHEVYGQSEDTGPTTFNLPGQTRFGSVGRAIPGLDLKIAEDGEILARGPNVFPGYYKDPEATSHALIEGWLHSGDLGRVDADGYLFITGRKKDIIITAGGKNIAPKNIEGALKDCPLVGEAVVIGDRRKYLTVLVSLDLEQAAAFAAEHGVQVDEVHRHPEAQARVAAQVELVNRELARVEQVKKFTIVPRAFSIEGGELTPTLKVKRSIVHRNYSVHIEEMYAEREGRAEAGAQDASL